MKFIKPNWEDPPEAWPEYIRLCASHLEVMRFVLPPNTIALAELRGVDDGLIVEVVRVRSEQTLKIVLRCGDLQMGYYDLVLTYSSADISPKDSRVLARLARTTVDSYRHKSDVSRHEVDITTDGRIEHRLEFHVYKCDNVSVAIRCGSLDWEKVEQPNRELPILLDRFCDSP